MSNSEELNDRLALKEPSADITDLTVRLPSSNIDPSRAVPVAARKSPAPGSITIERLFSALLGLMFRFAAALCLLASASYLFKSPGFLPPANIPCAAVIAVLGTPGLALLISLNLLV